MANHISHAALPYPIKGCRFTLLVPYIDADGDPTDPTTPDTERSIDAAAFADCTEEVSTITGSNGMGFITLTGDEMNGSAIAVCAKVASGPKATLATLYPRVLPIFTSGTAQAGAAGTITLASGAVAIDDYYNGCIIRTTGGTGGAGGSGSLGNQARVITDYVGSTKVATISPSWETNPSSDTTYEVLLAETALIGFSNAVQWNGTAVPVEHTAGYPTVTVKDGTGTGELDTASGVVLAKDHTGAALATPTNITAGTMTTVTNLTNAPTSGDLTATMKTSVTTAATAATPAVTVSDKTGFSLSAGGIQAIWDALTSALTTVGSVGKVIADFITGNAFTRLGAPVGASISADIAGVQADTDNIQTRVPAALVSGRMDASVGAMATDTLTAAALAADAVTEIQSGLSTLNAAGVRTAVGLASANLDTQLGDIDNFLDTEVAAIKAQTDLIPASPAAVGSAMTLAANAVTAAALATDAVAEIADGVLDRNMATGTDSSSNTVRTLRSAVRKIRNKYSSSGGVGTVTKEDDTTTAYTEVLTTNAAADPITGWDPS